VTAVGNPPAPGAVAQRIPLSLQQEFLCLFDGGDSRGPFGPRYTIVGGWRLRGPLDLAALRAALGDVVARHEALRTTIVRGPADRYQLVAEPGAPRLAVRDLTATVPEQRDRVAEELVNEVESGTLAVRELPVLRAVLGRFDGTDAMLVLSTHHTAVDGWSMQVLVRDLATCYAVRRGLDVPALPPVTQYRAYAVRQRAGVDGPRARRARGFWRENLAGARILAVPTDHERVPQAPRVTSWYRFTLDADLRTATTALAVSCRASVFMVLQAAFCTLLAARTGITDLVVPTFTPGRGEADLADSVGSFFNFLPVRTEVAGCGSFLDLLGRVRAACLAAYAHELPFAQILAEAPDLMAPAAEPRQAACVFQVVQSPFVLADTTVGDLAYTALRRRLRSQPVGSDIPDGLLWGLEPDRAGDIVGSVAYSSDLYQHRTVRQLVADYTTVLAGAVRAPRRRPPGL